MPANLSGHSSGSSRPNLGQAPVGRLLLHPELLFDVGVPVQRLGQPPPGQRGELLDERDRDVIALVLGLVGGQLVVDLAAGQQYPPDLVALPSPAV